MAGCYKAARNGLAVVAAVGLAAGIGWSETFTTDTLISTSNNTYEDHDIVVTGCTLSVNGPHVFHSLQLINGAVLTHSAAPEMAAYALNLTIATEMAVDASSRVDVVGKGFPKNTGPGTMDISNSGGSGGAGHGGEGGYGSNISGWKGGHAYDSITAPMDMGSGAYSSGAAVGGTGGGCIRLLINGVLALTGNISANGGNGTAGGGGGSGGSVYITAASVTGAGTVSVDGGAAGDPSKGGGGGGGRIAFYCPGADFGGSFSAAGGAGFQRGGAGTVYVETKSWPLGSLSISNGGGVGAVTYLRDSMWPAGTVADVGVQGAATVHPVKPLTLRSLIVSGNGVVSHDAGTTDLDVAVQGDLTIAADGSINANGRGYAASTGPGTMNVAYTGGSGGAGYGGEGGYGSNISGWTGGHAYGSIIAPDDMGSGGFTTGSAIGGPGGGYVKLTIGGTLINSGSISVNGGSGGAGGGGGSGGAVYITAASTTGLGSITADGGSAGDPTKGGGGGGGRIAFYCATADFGGTLSAVGGTGFQRGGAGTVYRKTISWPPGIVSMANGGSAGAPTYVRSSMWTDGTVPDLLVNDYALAHPVGPITFHAVEVSGNGVISHDAGTTSLRLAVEGNLSILADGSINANGRGYAAGTGPGTMNVALTGGSGGAGYGGEGGHGSNVTAWRGGHTYGSIIAPDDMGSGAWSTGTADGGAGGGYVWLTVGGELYLMGSISANGANGGAGGGGGSGGAVHITTASIAGTGRISVDGGDAGDSAKGGGGGGGRIAFDCPTDFNITMSAAGGAGFQRGGAGTVYSKVTAAEHGLITVANGSPGAPTYLRSDMWPGAPVPGLAALSNAMVHPVGPITFQTVNVASGGTLSHDAGTKELRLIVLGNMTVAADGLIDVNGRGYQQGDGPGTTQIGLSGGSGGAGHGGKGGAGSNATAWPGGRKYDVNVAPIDLGSGAGDPRTGEGGAGGGIVRLRVTGDLTVNGTISANGANGTLGGGGGSGGSIYLRANSLQGNGVMMANGGACVDVTKGGGGGGGRVAIYRSISGWTGTLAVDGGAGKNSGEPGTIYISSGTRVTGDANNDEEVNLADVAIVLRVAAGLDAASVVAGDLVGGDVHPAVTPDARWTLADADTILRAIQGFAL